jgi:tetratricopeptide (TPR) repeat protein
LHLAFRELTAMPAAATASSPAADDGAGHPLADLLERAGRLVRRGQIDSAEALCAQAWPQVKAADDALQMGLCQYVLSLCHQYRGALDDSVAAGYRAITQLGRAEAHAMLLRVLALQAINVVRIGEAPEALDLLERAMTLLPRVPDALHDQCVFWNNAASTHQVLGRRKQAVEAGERALAMSAQLDDPDLAALCRGNLLAYRLELLQEELPGVPCDETLQTVAAMQAYLAEQVEAGRHHMVSYCSAICADTLIALERLDEARQVLQRGAKSAKAAGVGPDRGTIELRLASVERLQGQYRAAAAHIAVAHELAAQSHDRELLARVYLENSRLHEMKSQWRAALDCHKTYAEIREALLKAQADSRAQLLATRAGIERAPAEAPRARRSGA